MHRILTKFVDSLSGILLNIGMVCMACAMVLVFAQTVMRYVFSLNYEWIEEVSRYLIIFTGFSLCGYVTYNKGHVSLEVVYDSIKNERIRKVMDIISVALSTFLACLIFKWAMDVFINAGSQVTMSQIFPLRLPYSLLPIGMVIQIFFAVLKIIALILEMSGEGLEEEGKGEE